MFVIETQNDGRMWRYALRADDGTILAIGGRRFANRDECGAAIEELFGPYPFRFTVRQQGNGRWSWEISKAGRPLLVSPRSHTLPAQCGAAMRKVKWLVEAAARGKIQRGDRRVSPPGPLEATSDIQFRMR